MSDTRPILSLIAPFLAERASRFGLTAAHPHRLFTERPEPIGQYHARLARAYQHSLFAKPEACPQFIFDLVVDGFKDTSRVPSVAVVQACGDWVQGLLDNNDLTFALPALDRSLVGNDNYVVPLRQIGRAHV